MQVIGTRSVGDRKAYRIHRMSRFKLLVSCLFQRTLRSPTWHIITVWKVILRKTFANGIAR